MTSIWFAERPAAVERSQNQTGVFPPQHDPGVAQHFLLLPEPPITPPALLVALLSINDAVTVRTRRSRGDGNPVVTAAAHDHDPNSASSQSPDVGSGNPYCAPPSHSGPLHPPPSPPVSGCLSLCWSMMRCLSTFAVAILSGAVIFLFFQVQALQVTVKSEQEQINSLNGRLANQTNVQIQALTDAVNEEHAFTLYQMAGMFALLACLLTSFHMYSHLRNYKEPLVQRKIVTILWMSPIYAVTSFLSLIFPVADGYLAVIKDFYEAYAIFTFLSFLIAVLGRGDRQVAIQVLSRHADHLKQPTRCLNSCYHPPPYVSDEAKAGAVVTECQILAMQFVFIRPITSILAFVYNTIYESNRVHSNNSVDQDFSDTAVAYFTSPPFFLAMVTNVSVFLAFTGLLKFYHAVRDDLKWCQPFSKFMTIKGIVFLTFWQGLLISIVVSSLDRNDRYDGNVKSIQHNPTSSSPTSGFTGTNHSTSSSGGMWGSSSSPSHSSSSMHNSTHHDRYLSSSQETQSSHVYTTAFDEAAQIQNFLICLEMLFFSIAHYCVFPAEEWEPGYRPQAVAKPGIGLKDFVSDMSYIISSKRRRNRGCVAVPSFEDDDDDMDAETEDAYRRSRRKGGNRLGGIDDEDDASDIDDREDEPTADSEVTPGFPDVLVDPEGDLRRRRSRRSSDGSSGEGGVHDRGGLSTNDDDTGGGDAFVKSAQEIV